MPAHQVAIIGAAAELDGAVGLREGGAAHRHMFVPGLHRLTATQQEQRGIGAVLIKLRHPVVVDLMVVIGAEPRVRGAGGLQVRVHRLLRVADAIVAQRIGFAANIVAHRLDRAVEGVEHRARAIFVDIVAIVEDEVELLLCDMAVGGVVARLEMLAADRGEAHLVDFRAHRRQRAGEAGQALLAGAFEAIPVKPAWLEPRHLDMHRMGEFGVGRFLPLSGDGLESVILRHLPVDRDGGERHAALRLERTGCEPRPDHEAVGQRVTGRHAERERIVREAQRLRADRRGQDEGSGQEAAQHGAARGD